MSLSAEHLGCAYGKRTVLSDVSFTAENGTLTAVMGPNGVGKTTLFRCILQLITGYTGSILVDGKPIDRMSVRELAHHIAYIPQIHGMAFSYTVREMVLMGTAHQVKTIATPGKKELAAANDALERMHILQLANRDFSRLSGGEQQLVLIARALAQGTKTILMDEPTASLDYGNQMLVITQAHALAKEGYTILLSTHDPQHALWYADQVLALADGGVCACGAPEEVLDAALIERLYGISTVLLPTEQGTVIVPRISK